jgi:hypothetical protein
MAVVDPHQRIAVLENKLQAANVEIEWAHFEDPRAGVTSPATSSPTARPVQ